MGIKQSTPEKSASGKASSLFNNPRQPDLSRLRGALKFFMCNSEGFALRFAVFGVAAMTLFSALFLFPGYRVAWVIIGICAALIATAKKIVPISGNLPHWMKEEGPSPQRRRQLESGKIIVTGASSGMGRETTMQLLRWSAMRSPALKIVMAVRDVQKGAKVREELSEILGRELAHKSLPADVFKRRMGDAMNAISVEALDLCDMKSVNAFISRMNSKSGKTSVLVNNAGAVTDYASHQNVSIEFLVNLVAPVRLVNGLHFASRSGARVISLTSSSNLTITKDLNFEACARNVELLGEECPSQKPYCLAKLGLVAMSKHFATTRGKHDDVVTVAADPGAVATPMLHTAHEKFDWETSPYHKVAWTAISWFSDIYMKTPEEGAATTLFLLCADGKDVINGGYYSDCKRNEAGVCALYSDKAFTAGTAGPRAAAMMLGMKKIGDEM